MIAPTPDVGALVARLEPTGWLYEQEIGNVFKSHWKTFFTERQPGEMRGVRNIRPTYDATEITKLRAELAACRAASEGAVAVKPLVWVKYGLVLHRAADLYCICQNAPFDKPDFGLIIGRAEARRFNTLDAAKAAAQADYEARIRAALSQPSEPDGTGIGDGS